ncbi:MAG TPA: alpha/beta fold hydrolase [Thermoanaerobaculia bacterium]|nr:alpha/beta fold hydrolase [Thermoanaerobaculia bacterium]
MMNDFLSEGPRDSGLRFVLAHGAGSGMRTPFMAAVSRALGAEGIEVVRFEFPYMKSGRKAPDREPVLLETWRSVVEQLGGGSGLVIGGKSMGGRIGSMVADEVGARGLVCLGYPFHPPGKPETLRTAHLEAITTPTLIVQGTRDAFGTPLDVAGYKLSSAIRIEWIQDADHSLKQRSKKVGSEEENLRQAVSAMTTFIKGPPSRIA